MYYVPYIIYHINEIYGINNRKCIIYIMYHLEYILYLCKKFNI